MTEKPDQLVEQQTPAQQQSDDRLEDEEFLKLKRRKNFELVANFVIVIIFLLALLIGFALYIYQRMAG